MIDLTGATDAQKKFITDLMSERVFVADTDVLVSSPKDASNLISKLLLMPKKAGGKKVDEELQAALKSVPKSKYAIPTSELFPETLKSRLVGDLLFVELSEYRGRLKFQRLFGAPGCFSRGFMPRGDALVLLAHIARDPYNYTRLFGEHYRCCGRCGAELTDKESRSLLLGPTCRQYFGL